MGYEEFKLRYFGTVESRCKSMTILMLFLLMTAFVIYQIIKVTYSVNNPLYAYVFEETVSPSQVFPEVAICPGRNFSNWGTIGAITCTFIPAFGQNQSLSVISNTFNVDGNNLACFTVNPSQTVTAYNYTDLIRCSIQSDLNVLVYFYDPSALPVTNWFGWTVLPYQQDTSVGIIKWFYQGQDLGYQVETIEQEFRFDELNVGVLLTIEWNFLGKAVYGQVTSYDFWTALGVIGGYIYLATKFYQFILWSSIYIIGTKNYEKAHNPNQSDYGAL